MSETIKTKIKEGLTLHTSNGYFKSLVIKNEKLDAHIIENTIDKYSIRRATIWDKINSEHFKQLQNLYLLGIYDNYSFDPYNLYKLNKLLGLVIEFTKNIDLNFSDLKNLEELEIQWNKSLRGTFGIRAKTGHI